ncbi:MAG TPA: 1,4-dihydroxy-2-naphthoate polyprenyltransferase [Acidimicrobiales bacterium]
MSQPRPPGPSGPAARAVPTGWRLWLAGARPRTLPAAVVPVIVGTAVAAGVHHANAVGWFMYAPNRGVIFSDDVSSGLKGLIIWRALAAMVVALFIQIGTNFANDYSDGVKGTDNETRVGPVRLVGSGLKPPGAVKKAAFASFGVAALAGLALAAATTWWLIPVGLVCFAAGWLYTGGPKPYGYYGFGELFVFVFFGLVATMGSTFVQLQRVTWLSLACAVPVGALATALLVINNLRDIPTDTVAGKRTLAVRLGDQRTRVLYVVLMVVPYLALPFIAGLGRRPLAVLAFAAIFVAQKPVLWVLQGARGPALIPVLGRTGRVQLVFGALLAAGLFISA